MRLWKVSSDMVNNIRNSTYIQQLVEFAKNNLFSTFGIIFVSGILTGWLAFGWWLFPVEWENADPESLHPHFMSEWVQMSADSYVLTTDIDKANKRVKWLGEESFGYVEYARSNALGPEEFRIAQLQKALGSIADSKVTNPDANLVEENITNETIEISGSESGMFSRSVLVAVVGGFLVAAVMSGIGYYVVKNIGLRPKRELQILSQNIDDGPAINDEDEVNDIRSDVSVNEDTERGTPLARFMTTFLLGDDLYDDSFGIDDANGDFLGECGMGISDIIGVGEPKKVCAFEIWLFDKNDVRTVTKVLMSEDAFGDDSKRTSLAPKGEPLMADSGKAIVLETASLYVSARIVDMQYGGGALPQNSFFNQLTLEFSAWRKV